MTAPASTSAPNAPNAPSTQPSGRSGELLATVLVAAIGLPLLFTFGQAIADGEQRRREAPIRAIIGDDSFERLQAGEQTQTHYYGAELAAPDFTLVDRAGKPWKLSDQRGKVVVMNFWTVTCKPCVQEMPSLMELAAIAAKKPNVEVVAVTTDENWAAIEAIMPPSVPLKILFDPKREVVGGLFGSRMFPETWVIDPGGLVRLRVDGPREWNSALSIDAIESFL